VGLGLGLLEGLELIGEGVIGDNVGEVDGLSLGEFETIVGCVVGVHL
jgi:Na+/H+-translocating membrane pyrophosphatase